jgi:hypothetical protein
MNLRACSSVNVGPTTLPMQENRSIDPYFGSPGQ